MRYTVQLKPGQAPVQDVALTVRLNKIPPPRIVHVTAPSAPVGAGWVSKFYDGDPFWEDSGVNPDHPFFWSAPGFGGPNWETTDGLHFGSEALVPVTTGAHAGWQVGYRPTKARISFQTELHGADLVIDYFEGATTPAVYDGVTINTRTNEALSLSSDLARIAVHAGDGGAYIRITDIEFFEP
jgi:hypothetical protein